jgi:hypothetical protein
MKNKYDEITLLNSANMPSDGLYNKKTISKNQFIEIIKNAKIINSSIGYESVSKLIKKLTNIDVNVNRNITYINNNTTIVGLTLSFRVNPENKGYMKPGDDDYIYFLAEYKQTNNENNKQNT